MWEKVWHVGQFCTCESLPQVYPPSLPQCVSCLKQLWLFFQVKICAQKLVRAEKLIGGLGGEKDRWSQAAADLQAIYDNLLGDVLIAAGVIAYLGPFTTAFREKCTTAWVCLCKVHAFRICLEQSAGVSTGIAVTARFSQQTEDRAFCPVVQQL